MDRIRILGAVRAPGVNKWAGRMRLEALCMSYWVMNFNSAAPGRTYAFSTFRLFPGEPRAAPLALFRDGIRDVIRADVWLLHRQRELFWVQCGVDIILVLIIGGERFYSDDL